MPNNSPDPLSPQSLIGIHPNESIVEGVSRQLATILVPGGVQRLRYIFGITSRQNEITKLYSRLSGFQGGLENARLRYTEICLDRTSQKDKLLKVFPEYHKIIRDITFEITLYERLIMFTDQMLEHTHKGILTVQARLAMK